MGARPPPAPLCTLTGINSRHSSHSSTCPPRCSSDLFTFARNPSPSILHPRFTAPDHADAHPTSLASSPARQRQVISLFHHVAHHDHTSPPRSSVYTSAYTSLSTVPAPSVCIPAVLLGFVSDWSVSPAMSGVPTCPSSLASRYPRVSCILEKAMLIYEPCTGH